MKKKQIKLDYSPQLNKEEMEKAQMEKQMRIDKAQRHLDYLKRKGEYKDLLEIYALKLTGFLTAKPKEKDITELIGVFAKKINTEACKFILRCYGVPFKVKEMYSQKYKEMVAEVLNKIVKTPEQLARLIQYLDKQPYNISINNIDNIKVYVRRLK